MNKKLLILAALATILLGAGLATTTIANAEDSESTPPFMQRIVERFGLDADEVKTFMEQEREQKRLMMHTSKEDRLDQAVADGVLTEEQKTALVARWQERWQEMEEQREQHRLEMQQWMDEQGIDHEALQAYGGFGMRGPGHGKMLMMR